MEIIRKHYVFYGAVQGVGFRYRALHAARSFGVSGWVRNSADATVEMEAQGTLQSIEDMILFIEKGTYVRIENMQEKEIPVKNSRGFEIKD